MGTCYREIRLPSRSVLRIGSSSIPPRIDLAFFLGGEPKELSCFTFDKLAWHKPAVFTGAGITNTGALFSYQANWNAPGRWGIEILTSQHRLYLRPMEKLQIQNTGSVDISEVEIDDQLDKEFKPWILS